MTFGEMRRQAGYTQEELAKILGVSETTVSLYELRKHEPRLKMVVRLAEVFSVSVEEIVFFYTNKTPVSKYQYVSSKRGVIK